MAHPEEGHKHGQRDKMTRLTDCKARTETSASQEAGLVMRELKGGFPSFLGSRWEVFEGSSQLVSAENPIPHQKFCHLKTWTHMTHFHPMGWTVTISPEAPRMPEKSWMSGSLAHIELGRTDEDGPLTQECSENTLLPHFYFQPLQSGHPGDLAGNFGVKSVRFPEEGVAVCCICL